MMCRGCGFFIRFQSDHDAKCPTRSSASNYAWAILDDPNMMTVEDEGFLASFHATYRRPLDNHGTESGTDSVLPATPDDAPRADRGPDDDEVCPAGYGI